MTYEVNRDFILDRLCDNAINLVLRIIPFSVIVEKLLNVVARAYSSVVERVTDNDEVLSSILSTPIGSSWMKESL